MFIKKRIIAIIGILAMLLLVGCANDKDEVKTDGEAKDDTQKQEEKTELDLAPLEEAIENYLKSGLGFDTELMVKAVPDKVWSYYSDKLGKSREELATQVFDGEIGANELLINYFSKLEISVKIDSYNEITGESLNELKGDLESMGLNKLDIGSAVRVQATETTVIGETSSDTPISVRLVNVNGNWYSYEAIVMLAQTLENQ